MKTVWVLVDQRSRVCGHGDSEETEELIRLGPYGTGPRTPAFLTKEAAEQWAKREKLWGFSAVRLEVHA